MFPAGIVTSFTPATTRTGRPYSKTVLEDKSSSWELALFGKDHEAFMSYMQPNAALYLEGEIDEKYGLKPEERAQGKTAPYAFRLRKVSLLGNVTEELLRSFSIELETSMLTPAFRQDLLRVVKRHKGGLPMMLYLSDPVTKYRIQFYSKKFQVTVTSEFIRDLAAIGVHRYDVQKK